MSGQLMVVVVSLASVTIFSLLFLAFRVHSNCLLAVNSAKEAFDAIANKELPDQVKEAVSRREAGRLLFQCCLLTLKSALCLAVALVPVYVGWFLHMFTIEDVHEFSLMPLFWIAILLFSLVIAWVGKLFGRSER